MMVIMYSIIVFISIIVIVRVVINIVLFDSILKLMFVFMVIKKSLRRSFLKGLMLVFNLCLNLLLVSIMLVRNVFRVGERLINFIRVVILIISINVVVVKILCRCDEVINLNKGWFR